MALKFNGSTRALLVILAAILLIHLARFTTLHFWPPETERSQSPQDFTLAVYGDPGSVAFADGGSVALPQLDVASDQWTFVGERIFDFLPYMQALELDAHGSHPYVIVRLSEGASVDDYRAAISSLAARGICRVGVLSPGPEENLLPPDKIAGNREPVTYVPVYRIMAVKDKSGVVQTCKDRFPAWR